jgi:hypothetical protein
MGSDRDAEVMETTAIGWGAVQLDGVIANPYPLHGAYILDAATPWCGHCPRHRTIPAAALDMTEPSSMTWAR